jgi:hypothetical protein
VVSFPRVQRDRQQTIPTAGWFNCRVQYSFYTHAQNCEKRLLTSWCPSARNNSAPTGRIFMKFRIWGFFENLSRKFKFRYYVTRELSALGEDVSRWRSWLRHWATSRKVAGSISSGVIGIFHWRKPWDRLSHWQKWTPGLFPGGRGGRCFGLITLPCLEIWKPQPPEALRACPGM